MSKTVTIPLDEPFEGHRGMVSQIVLRKPRWEDIMGTGAPYTIHRDAENKPFVVYDEIAIKHYAEVCLVEPADPVIVEGQVGLADTLKVREALIGFFLDAAAAGGGSKTSPKNSSSNSAGSPTPSAD